MEKISAWNLTSVKSEKQVIDEARTRSVSKKRSIRGKRKPWIHSSTAVQILFEGLLQPELLVNIGICPSANSIKIETGCKAGDKCLFPHYKVEEQVKSRKRAFKTKQATTRVLQLLCKTVPQLCCVSQDLEPSELLKARSIGEPRGGKFWDQFDEYNVKQVSEK